MKCHLGIVLLAMLLGVLGLKAQNMVFFTSRNGLSNSGVRNIYEDSRHSIWVTTLNGLSRYDGVKIPSRDESAPRDKTPPRYG